MRKQQLIMFVSLLLVAVVAAAQTPSRLDRVDVVRGTDDIRIVMTSSGAITPKLSTLDTPARLVVDLPAVFLYTPVAIYVHLSSVHVPGIPASGDPSQRFRKVVDWSL